MKEPCRINGNISLVLFCFKTLFNYLRTLKHTSRHKHTTPSILSAPPPTPQTFLFLKIKKTITPRYYLLTDQRFLSGICMITSTTLTLLPFNPRYYLRSSKWATGIKRLWNSVSKSFLDWCVFLIRYSQHASDHCSRNGGGAMLSRSPIS